MSAIRLAALDAIADLAVDLSAYLSEGAKSVGLTTLRCSALFELQRRGPQRQKVLGELLGVGPQQAGVLVDALTKRGLVARTPDPKDRRAVVVQLTPQGAEIAEKFVENTAVMAEQLLGDFAEDDLVVLCRLIRRVDDRARELRRKDS